MNNPLKINGHDQRCTHCAHYFITHEANFRYGCRAMDFKSKRQPVLDVIDASGQPCLRFAAKKPRASRG